MLVDGRTEIIALRSKLQREFGIVPALRRAGCNGRDVSVEAYVAASLGTLLTSLRGPWLHIVCIVDREGRSTSSENFALKLHEVIISEVLENAKYHKEELETKILVCVPDRMFENWILADVEGIKRLKTLIREFATQKQYDGMNGASELRKIMKRKYNKVIHAPKLFSLVSFKRGKTNSPSFNRFVEALEG
jgi:hypothetical protein